MLKSEISQVGYEVSGSSPPMVTASRSASQTGPAQRTPKVVKLRDYQARLLDDYDPEHDTLIEQPTGSGKTLMIVAMVPGILGASFDNILIIAPQTQIEEGFVDRPYSGVKFPDGRVVDLPKLLIRQARDRRGGSLRSIHTYLAVPQDHALATTHAAIVRVEDLPEDCRRKLLVIDEAHHWPFRPRWRRLSKPGWRGAAGSSWRPRPHTVTTDGRS